MENQFKNDLFIKKLLSEASNRFLNKQFESVVALTDKILLLVQDHYDALTMRAMSLEDLGYYLDALDDYNKAIRLRPSDANIIGLCGLCYNTIGDYQKAREYLELSVNKGSKMYATNLYMIESMSEGTLKVLAERRNTPERRKRRTDKDFTISNEELNLDTINENLKEFYFNLKSSLQLDPENDHIKKLVEHYRKYFEEN